MHILLVENDSDLERCFPVMVQLRPHLTQDSFMEQVHRQYREGYRIACVVDEESVQAVAGFRLMEMLWRGRSLYIDDLVTDAQARSRGYGDALVDWLTGYARQHGCARLDLDSGVQRFDAHRFYFRKRMYISSYHFSLDIPPEATR